MTAAYDPRLHAAHTLPLAHRIVADLLNEHINRAADAAAAVADSVADEYAGTFESGAHSMEATLRVGVDELIVPQILDALGRAGLLALIRGGLAA